MRLLFLIFSLFCAFEVPPAWAELNSGPCAVGAGGSRSLSRILGPALSVMELSKSFEQFEVGIHEQLEMPQTTEWMAKHTGGDEPRSFKIAREKAAQGKLEYIEFIQVAAEFARQMGFKPEPSSRGDLTFNLGQSVSRFLPTFQNTRGIYLWFVPHGFSMLEHNRISPLPIFPVELALRPKSAHKRLMPPYSWAGHDLVHAIHNSKFFRTLLAAGVDFETYRTEIRKRVAFRQRFEAYVQSRKNPDEREFLEAFWFVAYHEQTLVLEDPTIHTDMSPEGMLSMLAVGASPYKDAVLAMEGAGFETLGDYYSNPGKITKSFMKEALQNLEDRLRTFL